MYWDNIAKKTIVNPFKLRNYIILNKRTLKIDLEAGTFFIQYQCLQPVIGRQRKAVIQNLDRLS
jgi:hypothetical protein